jgi:hypothetical protein
MVRSILALAAVLSVASASLAADLVTPPATVGSSTTAACMLTNITSAPILAQFEMIDLGGYVGAYSGQITVPAGFTKSILWEHPETPVYCRFVNASKSKVRADMVAFAPTGDGTDQLVIPAQ